MPELSSKPWMPALGHPEIATIWMGSVVKAIEMVFFLIVMLKKGFKCHSRSLVTSLELISTILMQKQCQRCPAVGLQHVRGIGFSLFLIFDQMLS